MTIQCSHEKVSEVILNDANFAEAGNQGGYLPLTKHKPQTKNKTLRPQKSILEPF